jgi:hypothetical protein
LGLDAGSAEWQRRRECTERSASHSAPMRVVGWCYLTIQSPRSRRKNKATRCSMARVGRKPSVTKRKTSNPAAWLMGISRRCGPYISFSILHLQLLESPASCLPVRDMCYRALVSCCLGNIHDVDTRLPPRAPASLSTCNQQSLGNNPARACEDTSRRAHCIASCHHSLPKCICIV